MPKEQLNWPEPGGSVVAPDGESAEYVPMTSIFSMHWMGSGGPSVVQLSVSVAWSTLEKMVDQHRKEPESWWGSDPDRAEFYSEGLNRGDLNQMIKTARRARNTTFGADE